MKRERWVIDVPKEEFEMTDILRIQTSDKPIEGGDGHHEVENAYYVPLKEGFHYEWRSCGEYFKSFEEAKKHLLKMKELNKIIHIPGFDKEKGTISLRFPNGTEVDTTMELMKDLFKRMKSLDLIK